MDCHVGTKVPPRNDAALFAKQTVKDLVPKYLSALVPSKRVAFTLAETLITLGIIGVVAAMTISNVVVKYQKQTTAKKLHQAYNFLQQVTSLAQNDYGDIETWDCFNITNNCSTEDFAKQYLLPYLQDTELKVYGSVLDAGYKRYPKYWNNGGTLGYNNYYIIKVKQGYVYIVGYWESRYRYFEIYIDINGTQKPNIVGKDIFTATYGYNKDISKQYRLQMANYFNANRDELLSDYCNKNQGAYTYYCGALIEMDDWEIKDDYPW